MRRYFAFWWLCARTAFWGNTAFANDWQWVFGIPVVSGFVIWANARYGADFMTTGNPIADGFLGALSAFIVTWTIAYVIRFSNSPVTLYHAEKNRADKLEELRNVANDVTRPPSFDIGFERIPYDPEKQVAYGWTHYTAARIWVENLEGRPIENCRVVIENFSPDSPIKNGAMLWPDNRGSEDEKNARFDLAATEKRFFKFIDLSVWPGRAPDTRLEKYGYSEPGYATTYTFELRSDQESGGWTGVLSRTKLETGKRYFATIVIHAKNANSRRIDLTLDTMDNGELHIIESEATAQYRKEASHEKQTTRPL